MDSENKRILSADEIWAAEDIREGTVEVPEWGGSVKIRGLTLQQMSALATRSMKRDLRTGQEAIDRETSVALTLIYGMIEPQLSEQDAQRLKDKSAAAVTRIVQAITALGPTEEAVDDAAKSHAPESNGAVSIFPGARAENDQGRVATAHVDDRAD